MDRAEKLRLSADREWCHCFKHGMFTRFYEQNLYWFSFAVKPLKPMPERVKSGEPLIYGGLPIASFEKLLGEGALQKVQTMAYGWRWPYAAQKALPEGALMFDEWRSAALAETAASTAARQKDKPCDRNVLAEIAGFNLAAHTPLQVMTAIAEWQEYLMRREGAG